MFITSDDSVMVYGDDDDDDDHEDGSELFLYRGALNCSSPLHRATTANSNGGLNCAFAVGSSTFFDFFSTRSVEVSCDRQVPLLWGKAIHDDR